MESSRSLAGMLSLRRVLENDYLAFLGAFLPAMFWVTFLITRLVSINSSPVILYLAITATVVGPPLAAWRYWLIRRVFVGGVEVPGKIEEVYFYRDRGRVVYNYQYQDQPYRASNVIHRTARTRALKNDQAVTLVVDPESPKRAYIRELYV